MAKVNWENVYNTEIITRGEHNRAFSLEEFLGFPNKTKKKILKKYKTISLLNSYRKDGEEDFFVPACGENSCQQLREFLNAQN